MAHALHAVISSGKWTNYSTDGSQITENGDAILEQLKKVSFIIKPSNGRFVFRNKYSIQRFKLENPFDWLFQVELTGTTDLIQFNDSGGRVNSNLDVKNLRDDKFVTVSSGF